MHAHTCRSTLRRASPSWRMRTASWRLPQVGLPGRGPGCVTHKESDTMRRAQCRPAAPRRAILHHKVQRFKSRRGRGGTVEGLGIAREATRRPVPLHAAHVYRSMWCMIMIPTPCPASRPATRPPPRGPCFGGLQGRPGWRPFTPLAPGGALRASTRLPWSARCGASRAPGCHPPPARRPNGSKPSCR